ncbi:hypothetical protein B0H14DRAFT_2620913 [Mycena olivaceomarginata]|nr:hypothetical protein B0H14DRAFT_2620913 [Mycena olivaceomarginata]
MYPQMRQQAGWDPAHAEHTGHPSVTFLRAISESEETESFVLAPAIISGVRCLSIVSEAGHRFILPGPEPKIRKAEREFRSPSGAVYQTGSGLLELRSFCFCSPPLSKYPSSANVRHQGCRQPHRAPARTRSSIWLSPLPKIFADIEAPDISDPDNPQLIQVPPKFAITFKDAPRWWEWTEPPPEIKLTPSELHNLKKWAAKLVHEMRNNKKEGERTPWNGETVQKFCRLWAIPAALWEREVEDVLERLEVTIKDMWYKAEPGECGDSGIPEVRVWQPHLGNILDALFPDLAGLRTATGNINGGSPNLGTMLAERKLEQHEEGERSKTNLGDDANDAEMAARWELLTDNAKKIEWAGWAYGQVEVLINRVRPQNKKREIDLTVLQNETLKAASATKSSQLANAKIRQATQEEIDEFDLVLADNLRVWGANEVEVATEVFNSLWLPVDEDPDVERWREETFMGGTDLGVEEEKDLSSETLCEMLGWNHETGIPAAFSPYIPCDPTLPSEASGGKEQTTLHWHQKVGVLAMLRKASQPPKNPRDRLPANASPIEKAIACRALKQGWANSPGVLLADDVGTGKTLQMLALVATLIQLFDYQESTGKTAPREEWPAALRFYESFGGREDGIPDAPHLFLIPSSILPQFVAEAHRFFRPGAVDIFTIGTAAKSWPADWARFHESKQKAIRRIVFMGHPELMPKTAQPFNKDWLTILIDEGHYARTGGKLYQAFQAAFETGLVRVVATATPMYQNLRDLVYITKLLHSERFKTTAEQKMFEMVGDYTRLRSKTRKTDIAHLTAQFETHRIAEDTMANSLTQKFGTLLAGILKVGRNETTDNRISEDLPPCTQVYVKVTLTPPELEAACDAMGGADVSQAIRETGRLGGNFFLGARKETAYYGSSEKSTKELHTAFRQFLDARAATFGEALPRLV